MKWERYIELLKAAPDIDADLLGAIKAFARRQRDPVQFIQRALAAHWKLD